MNGLFFGCCFCFLMYQKEKVTYAKHHNSVTKEYKKGWKQYVDEPVPMTKEQIYFQRWCD